MALAVLLGRHGASKTAVAERLRRDFGYRAEPDLAQRRARPGFDVTCQGTLPAALAALLEADTVEQAIRNAVSLGGDADTTACIAGAMAEACFGGVPATLRDPVMARLDPPLRAEVRACLERYPIPLP